MQTRAHKAKRIFVMAVNSQRQWRVYVRSMQRRWPPQAAGRRRKMRSQWGKNVVAVTLGQEEAAGAITPRSYAPARASAGVTAASRPDNRSAIQANGDAVLIGRVAQRDKSAMRVLYARHRLRVFRFALRILRDKSLAEDVSSEVFLDVWRQADRFEGRSVVLTWMLGITRIKAFSALRVPAVQELDDETAGAIEDPAEDPATILQRKETGAVIQKCLTKLSAEHREIIDLVYYHEKSIAEAAEIVGIPGNTVKTRMFCARKRLAKLLKAAGIRHATA
jgi:RNA polymerase sigma-70 factor (ECF subfamily)